MLRTSPVLRVSVARPWTYRSLLARAPAKVARLNAKKPGQGHETDALTPGEKAAITRVVHGVAEHLHFLDDPAKAKAAEAYRLEVEAREQQPPKQGQHRSPKGAAGLLPPKGKQGKQEEEPHVDHRHGDPEHGQLSSGQKGAVTRAVHGEVELHFMDEHPEAQTAAKAYAREVEKRERVDHRHGDPEHGQLSIGQKAAVTRELHGQGHTHFEESHPELHNAVEEYKAEVLARDEGSHEGQLGE
ncbi:hypothetical protein N2152v2_000841 [Parachlorella kessleri]